MTTFPDGVFAYGGTPLGPGDLRGIAIGRGFGKIGKDQDGRTKVIYVDKDVKTDRQGYYDGCGDSWANANSTLMSGINLARRNFGTTDINYDDEQDAWVIIAPGNYSSEGRIAFSTKNTHIIGLGTGFPGSDSGVLIGATASVTFVFGGGGSGNEVAGICIKLPTGCATGIYWANLEECWFHDINILCEGVTSSVGFDIYQSKESLIERVRVFNPRTAGMAFRYSAGTAEYCYNTIVKDNIFMTTGTCTDAIKVEANLVGPGMFINNYVGGNIFTETIDCDATSTQFLSAHNFLHGTTSAAQGTTIRGDVSS